MSAMSPGEPGSSVWTLGQLGPGRDLWGCGAVRPVDSFSKGTLIPDANAIYQFWLGQFQK